MFQWFLRHRTTSATDTPRMPESDSHPHATATASQSGETMNQIVHQIGPSNLHRVCPPVGDPVEEVRPLRLRWWLWSAVASACEREAAMLSSLGEDATSSCIICAVSHSCRTNERCDASRARLLERERERVISERDVGAAVFVEHHLCLAVQHARQAQVAHDCRVVVRGVQALAVLR